MEGASGIYIPQDFQAREPRTGTGAVLIEARMRIIFVQLRTYFLCNLLLSGCSTYTEGMPMLFPIKLKRLWLERIVILGRISLHACRPTLIGPQ